MNGLAISLVSLISMLSGYALLAFLWVKVCRESPEKRARRERQEEAFRRRVMGDDSPPR